MGNHLQTGKQTKTASYFTTSKVLLAQRSPVELQPMMGKIQA